MSLPADLSSADLKSLVPLLACPESAHDCRFEDRAASPDEGRQWSLMLGEPAPISRKLVCQASGATFPVTQDGIPVMWSSELRETFEHLETAVDQRYPTERDVKSANIHVYESIVDCYDSTGVHADPVTVGRLQSAFLQTATHTRVAHLDVGCGGGNVLELMRNVCGEPKVGLDVSLSALRAVRRKDFLAVLGDAERLPFRPGCFGLVTSSSVLHHLFAPERLIGEAARVLGPGASSSPISTRIAGRPNGDGWLVNCMRCAPPCTAWCRAAANECSMRMSGCRRGTKLRSSTTVPEPASNRTICSRSCSIRGFTR